MAVEIIVHPDPKRDAKAALLAETVAAWPRIVLKQDFGAIPAGTVVRRAPSSKGDGTHYKVCAVSCECPDYQQWGNVCKHVRAYRLFEARQQEQAGSADEADPTPTPTSLKSYRDLFPGCVAGCGELVERQNSLCYSCGSDEAYRLDRERRAVVFANGRIGADEIFQLNPLAE